MYGMNNPGKHAGDWGNHLIQQRDGDLEHLQEAQVTEGRRHFAVLRHGTLLCTLIHLIHKLVQDFQADHTVNDGVLGTCQTKGDNGQPCPKPRRTYLQKFGCFLNQLFHGVAFVKPA